MMSDDSQGDLGSGLVNPRLSDVFGLVIRQDEVDFVVPHLQEDLPLYLDPFLLWKSDRPEYQTLHASLLGFVEQVRQHVVEGETIRARTLLAEVSEPVEVGLKYAAGTKRGSALGPVTISTIIGAVGQIPQLEASGLDHMEMLALLVPGIAEDRISDLTASVIKGWLAQFTKRRCEDYGIPTRKYRLTGWDADRLDFDDGRRGHNPLGHTEPFRVTLR
jgi:hypothetical protein